MSSDCSYLGIIVLSFITVGLGYDPFCPYPSGETTFYPDFEDCHKFYECFAGRKFVLACPSNLFWNDTAKACDYRCDFGNSTSTTASSSSSGSTEPSTGSPFTVTTQSTTSTTKGDLCLGKPDGTFLPDPNDCRRFIECVAQTAESFRCPNATYWNQGYLSCIHGDC